MDEARHHLSTAEIERRLLAALCAPVLDQPQRAAILDRLAAHAFVEPDHETIFRALVKIPRATSEHIRETLTARLTRLGFPDVDVEPIFATAPPSPEKIRTLLQQLGD